MRFIHAGGCFVSRKNVSDRSGSMERIFEANTREEPSAPVVPRVAAEVWTDVDGMCWGAHRGFISRVSYPCLSPQSGVGLGSRVAALGPPRGRHPFTPIASSASAGVASVRPGNAWAGLPVSLGSILGLPRDDRGKVSLAANSSPIRKTHQRRADRLLPVVMHYVEGWTDRDVHSTP